jgi:hypothetical protein
VLTEIGIIVRFYDDAVKTVFNYTIFKPPGQTAQNRGTAFWKRLYQKKGHKFLPLLDFGGSISYVLISEIFGEKDRMHERRRGARHNISFPVRVSWKDENGKKITEEGLTENVGPQGALVFLPRLLPLVGSKVSLTITENPSDEVSVTAQVIRLERNASHPQAAFQLTDSLRLWKKKVWEYAGEILAEEKPEEFDDW